MYVAYLEKGGGGNLRETHQFIVVVECVGEGWCGRGLHNINTLATHDSIRI